MELLQEIHGETTVVSISGRLDGITCADAEKTLASAVSTAGGGLVLNLS